MPKELTLYSALSSIPVLKKSYIGKIMSIAFLGIHTPLLCLIVYLMIQPQMETSSSWGIFIISLLATLLGTVATIYVLMGLIKPVSLASSALRIYLKEQQLPNLPSRYEDEVGTLMSDVQHVIGELQSTIEQLKTSSNTDSLTGIINRKCMESKLRSLSSRLINDKTITIAMIDIDKFKEINDQHGHQVGDLCLQHFVKVINQNIRVEDSLSRWGGDEFLLMLNDPDVESAKKTYQRLIDSLYEAPIQLPNGAQLHLKASFGVTQFHENFHLQDSIKKADKMLYKAKSQGGQQVAFAM